MQTLPPNKLTKRLVVLLVLFLVFFESPIAAQEPESAEWYYPIQAAIENHRYEEAKALADDAVTRWPNFWRVYLTRGELLFRSGKMPESLVDFDKCLELNPRIAPSFWQRGLSLYYVGKFQAGREQFELHRTVNSSDVENPFWHFLCVAKLEGVEAAQKKILPCGHDARPPLMDILELIKGEKSFSEVVTTVEAIDKTAKQNAYDRFYGNYYLGLYCDALGQMDKAETFLTKSISEKLPGYMPDAARVHLELLRSGKLPTGK